MEKIVLESIKRTCFACPSQWEGKTTDGRNFYARYRWGHLEVWCSQPGKEISWEPDEYVLGCQIGDDFNGTLTYRDMVAACDTEEPGAIQFPTDITKIGDDVTEEELQEGMAKTAALMMELVEKGTIKIVSQEELNKMQAEDPDEVVSLTDDKFMREDEEARGHRTMGTEDLAE